MTTPYLCICGHVRGAHGGDSERCQMCDCNGFHSRYFNEKMLDLLTRVNALEDKLRAMVDRVDALQERQHEIKNPDYNPRQQLRHSKI